MCVHVTKAVDVQAMSDVIVDSKLTCMCISIDALVGIRLAKLVMYLAHGLLCFHVCTYL